MSSSDPFGAGTIFVLQKIVRGNNGREVQVTEGYTTDWQWAETWRQRASAHGHRFVVPVRKMQGAP